jgi:SAM-dependent methyltransferase
MSVGNVKKTYTDFHIKHRSNHLYPTEWVIRTMLGNYPELQLDRTGYLGGKALDLGFGDGRNMSLLNNCGLSVYGVETSGETVEMVNAAMAELNINVTLKVGSNSHIPFEDKLFDYVLACASSYYVDEEDTFSDNLDEITRVLKPGGYFIANFPAVTGIKEIPELFILENATRTDDGHTIIANDRYGLRNGYKFKVFHSKEEIVDFLSPLYDHISVGYCFDNFYGVQINTYIVTARKK